jgi:hypothetical protein
LIDPNSTDLLSSTSNLEMRAVTLSSAEKTATWFWMRSAKAGNALTATNTAPSATALDLSTRLRDGLRSVFKVANTPVSTYQYAGSVCAKPSIFRSIHANGGVNMTFGRYRPSGPHAALRHNLRHCGAHGR